MGSVDPQKNGWKIKKRTHVKRAVFYVYVVFWEQSGQAGVENGAMLTTYLFRYTSECSKNFQNFLRLRRQGGIDPPNQNPADVPDCRRTVANTWQNSDVAIRNSELALSLKLARDPRPIFLCTANWWNVEFINPGNGDRLRCKQASLNQSCPWVGLTQWRNYYFWAPGKHSLRE